MVLNSLQFGTASALREGVRVLSGSVAMETIIYFHLGNLCHYGLEVRWEKKKHKKNHKWTTVISVIIKKKREKRKILLHPLLTLIGQFCLTQKKPPKNIRLAFYFLSVFSGTDPTVINLLYNLFDLLKRPTITVTLY